MVASSSPALGASIAPVTSPRAHTAEDCRPTCDQPIPRDRAEEISARIRARQQAHETTVTTRLMQDFALEKTKAIEAAKQEGAAALEREREQGAARVAAAQEQARADTQRALREAETHTTERIGGIQRAHEQEKAISDAGLSSLQEQLNQSRDEAATRELQIREEVILHAQEQLQEQIAGIRAAHDEAASALLKRAKDAEMTIISTQEDHAALKSLLEQHKLDSAAALENAAADSAAREAAAREDEKRATAAAFHTRISEAELAKTTAQEVNAALQARLDQAQLEQADRETRARTEGAATATAAMQAQLEQAQRDKTAAETSAATSQADRQAISEQLAVTKDELQTQKATYDAAIAHAVQETREALEITAAAAIGAAKAEAHKEKQKVVDELAEVQRKLEKKTADDLGEGAEVKLIEALKEMFDGDRIDPVGKGNPGADIIHTVIHNGIECGKIIYDSKDHGQWRWDFVAKLASDKIAAKADHAILSIRKFPQDTRQLHIHDGVVLANPARVVALVQLIREHVIKVHTLRLSNEEKARKSAELYAFVTSAQFTDLLDRIDAQAQELQALQDDERKTHENHWKKQSIRFRSIQKARGDLSYRIEMIIGMADNQATDNGS